MGGTGPAQSHTGPAPVRDWAGDCTGATFKFIREQVFLNALSVLWAIFKVVRLGIEPGSYRSQVQRLNHWSGFQYRNDSLKILIICFAVLQFACVHLLYKIQMTIRSRKDLIIFIEAFLCLDTVFLSKYMRHNTKYIKYIR